MNRTVTSTRPKHGADRGQAMVELAIVAAAILVPLLLLIPLLGKQIDIKHRTIQAARYQAWEYTVWYTDNGQVSSGFDNASQPIKSTAVTEREARHRFFSVNTLPIEYGDRGGWEEANENPLWRTHLDTRLYDGATGDSSFTANASTPDPLYIFNGILNALDTVFELMADIASFLNIDVGFTAINTKGLFKTTVDTPTQAVQGARNVTHEFEDTDALFPATNVVAQAAVLGEGWNAGGREHAEHQIGGIVPTKILGEILEKEPFKTAQSIIGIFIPEFRPCNPTVPLYSGDAGSFWLGFIDFDTVHPDRLLGSDTDGHACFGGNCEFTGVAERVPTVVDSSENICGYRPE